ncbi:MAG: adenosylmethionine decarboxylase [Desulfurococcales archaeon]|nr:adenosylmethionine decarboxylase [Desulfurococcales archaeon]
MLTLELGKKALGDIIVGRHVYGSLYGVSKEKAGNEEFLRNVVVEAVRASGAVLHDIRSWKIPGPKGGVSVIALILESHVALHTWVEYSYATFDVFTCGERADPFKAFETILKALEPSHYTLHYADRSQLPLAETIYQGYRSS